MTLFTEINIFIYFFALVYYPNYVDSLSDTSLATFDNPKSTMSLNQMVRTKQEYNIELHNIYDGTDLRRIRENLGNIVVNCSDLFESIYKDPDVLLLVGLLASAGESRLYELSPETVKKYRDHMGSNTITMDKLYTSDEGPLINNCRVKNTQIPIYNIGDTLLHAAVLSGRPEVVDLLIRLGINVNSKVKVNSLVYGYVNSYFGDVSEMTALHYSSLIQDLDSVEICKLLLEAGADPNMEDVFGRTPLHTVGLLQNLHSKKVAKLLLKYGAKTRKRDYYTLTPLHTAASRNNLPVVSVLINYEGIHQIHEMSLEYELDNLGNTPLHIAALFNAGDVIPSLISSSDDIFQNNFEGKSPIEVSTVPIGCRIFDPEKIPAFSLTTLQRYLSPYNSHKYSTIISKGFLDAVEKGFLQSVQRLLFFQTRGDLLSQVQANYDLPSAIELARQNKHRKVQFYLESFGVDIVCPKPPSVSYASFRLSDTVLSDYIRVGDTVTYECYHGYQLVGSPILSCSYSEGKAFFVPSEPICSKIASEEDSVVYSDSDFWGLFILFGAISCIVLLLIIVIIVHKRGKDLSKKIYHSLPQS
ncbi:sushi domain-containing protein [Cryptosporidium andersoni]|uniref:Sushi domain-containing protein n=1 Tax=Cryptosporidium andersoni TaxID=117008 RepID=A0A1J4MTX7_9CRYT|nr:sushi domain-containing protein [Cryptosporidium andersoni]